MKARLIGSVKLLERIVAVSASKVASSTVPDRFIWERIAVVRTRIRWAVSVVVVPLSGRWIISAAITLAYEWAQIAAWITPIATVGKV